LSTIWLLLVAVVGVVKLLAVVEQEALEQVLCLYPQVPQLLSLLAEVVMVALVRRSAPTVQIQFFLLLHLRAVAEGVKILFQRLIT
jgi:hypothetical protein